MSHQPKWIAEFTKKSSCFNDCVETYQLQKGNRAERYRARSERREAITGKQERCARIFSTTASKSNDEHTSVPLTRKRKGPQNYEEPVHIPKKLRSSPQNSIKRKIGLTTKRKSKTAKCTNNKDVSSITKVVGSVGSLEESIHVNSEKPTSEVDFRGTCTSPRVHREEVRLSSNQHKESSTNVNDEDIEKPVDALHTGNNHEISEIEKPEYFYRLQRFNEPYKQGLYPKDIWSRASLMDHVARGSKGVSSRFISCCKTIEDLKCLGSITNESTRIREVVRINVTKLRNNQDVEVIDLTDVDVRERHISRSSDAWKYAVRFNEVILGPRTHVPAECVEKIGIVQHRTFTKDAHVNL